MKLSIKLILIFIISTVLSLSFFQIMSQIMISKMYQGESERMAGITGGVVTRFNSEVKSIDEDVNDYAVLYRSALNLEKEFNINDGEKKIDLIDKMNSDEIAYHFFLDQSLNLVKVFEGSEGGKGEINILVEKLKLDYEDREKGITKIVSSNSMPYILSVEPVYRGKNDKVIIGYMAGARNVDGALADKIGEVLQRKVSFVNRLEHPDKAIDSFTDHNEPIILENLENEVFAYYKIVSTTGEKWYFRVDEDLTVKKSASKTIKIFTFFISVAFFIVNIVLFTSIRKIILKRMILINDEVKKVTNNNIKNIDMEKLRGNDEIYQLGNDISTMISALESSKGENKKQEIKYKMLINSLTNGFLYFKVIKNENGDTVDALCIEANNAVLNILKIGRDELINKKISKFSTEKINYLTSLNEILNYKSNMKGIYLEDRKINDNTWVSVGIYSVEDEYFAIVMSDITKIKKYSEEMKYMANYDTVTKLKNRHGIVTKMERLIKEDKPFNVYFIDLDNFKSVNDYLGHSIGDSLLYTVGENLKKILGDSAIIGRIGGDEFIIISKGNMTDEERIDYGNEIIGGLSQVLKYNGYTYTLRASVGVSAFPVHGNDVETLLKYADIAMYKSKRDGKNRVTVISKYMVDDISIEGSLSEAIDNKEFRVYYQAIVDTTTKEIVGAEALVRWNRNGEIISPDKFITISKRSGEIANIDSFVMKSAIKTAKKIRERGFKNFEVSVNTSYTLLKEEGFVEVLKELLKTEGLEPSALKLEITEDEILDDTNYIIDVLNRIRDFGVKLSLDDFGEGYFSFKHLEILPVNTIKIDKSLIMRIEENERNKTIVKSIVNLSHTLGFDVICEGVEKESQYELLKHINADKIQGYLISKAVDGEEFINLLIENGKVTK